MLQSILHFAKTLNSSITMAGGVFCYYFKEIEIAA